jgi:serine protease Do
MIKKKLKLFHQIIVGLMCFSLFSACSKQPAFEFEFMDDAQVQAIMCKNQGCPGKLCRHKLGKHKKRSFRAGDPFKRRIEFAKSKVFPALVTIYAFPESFRGGRKVRGGGIGSGTIIHEDGYLITNAHVTQSAKKYKCMLSNKEEVTATLVGEDYATDLAILKLDLTQIKNLNPLPVAKFGSSKLMKSGDVVLALGSPLGLTRSLTMGVIANPVRFNMAARQGMRLKGYYRTGQYTNLIQHDATIHPGNSGGPLINLKGEIIAINELGSNDMYFSIPSDVAKDICHELMRHGRIIRSYLGFACGSIKDTGENQGALILTVDDESPVGRAGLKAGDFILAYDGTPVKIIYKEDLAPFYRNASNVPIGKEITLLIKRNGKEMKIKYVTRELESDWAEEREFRAWGMTAANISSLLRRSMRLGEIQGVYVTGVRALAGKIRPSLQGKVVTQIGDMAIKNLEDFNKVYKKYKDNKKKYSLVFNYTNGIHSFMGVLKQSGEKDPNTPDAKRSWIGIESQVFVTDLRRAMKLKKKIQGVRITRIFPNTLAEKSDLKVGDIITHVKGKAVKANRDTQTQVFPSMLLKYKVGQTIPLKVFRNGKTQTIEIELESAPKEPEYVKKAKDKDFEFGVREITFYDIVNRLWEKDVKGLVVTHVESTGWMGGKVRSGDLLVLIEDRKIESIDDFKEAMKAIKKKKPKRIKFLVRRGRGTSVSYVEPEWEQ